MSLLTGVDALRVCGRNEEEGNQGPGDRAQDKEPGQQGQACSAAAEVRPHTLPSSQVHGICGAGGDIHTLQGQQPCAQC